MNNYSGMAMATQRQAQDLGRARQHALAAEASSSTQKGHSIRRLFRLRRAPLPGAVQAPQGAVSSWRLSHRF
jgi:hypothetical protein